MGKTTIAKKNDAGLTRQLVSLIVPITLQSLVSAAVNSADVLMLGRAGQDALSAVSAAGQVTFILQLFYMGISGGLMIMSAQYWGKHDVKSVERLFGIATGLSAVVSMIFFLAAECAPGILLSVFTNDDALIRLGSRYLRALAPSYLVMAVSQMLPSVFRTTGRASISTVISAVSLIINVVLNGVSIFLLFPGRQEMIVVGIAAATCIARVEELIWGLLILKKGEVHLYPAAVLHPDRALLSDFFKNTTPLQFNYLAWGCGTAAISAIIGHVNSDLLAANAIVATVRNLATVICSGISGGSILVGQNLGRGDMQAAKKTGNVLVACSLFFGAMAGLIVLILRPFVFSLTDLSDRANQYLGSMLLICAVYCIGKSFNSTIVGGIFCAGGDTKFGLFCDVITMWVVIVPAGLLTAFLLQWPPVAVYLVLSLDEFVKIPAVVIHYKKEKWLKNITREAA